MGFARLKLCLAFALVTFIMSANGQGCPNTCYSYWQQGFCNSSNLCECTPGLYYGDDCSIPFDPLLDWDNIDCQHGGRFFPPVPGPGVNRYCVCPIGWTGTDCSVCVTNEACGSVNKTLCDNSLYITNSKYFNCSLTDHTLIQFFGGNFPGVTATVSFPDNQTSGGIANLTFFMATTGVPWAFKCNFSECSYTLDTQGVLLVTCQISACNTSSWSSGEILAAVTTARTLMTFTCQPDGTCAWYQKEIATNGVGNFALQCYAGECLGAPPDMYESPDLQFTRLFIIIGIGIAFILFSAIGSIGAYRLLKPHQYLDPPPFSTITLSFQNIACEIKTKSNTNRTILHSTSGVMQPGNITAIMGASGAGKTTFLDILAGRKNTGIVTGQVYLNDTPRDMKSFKRLAGYVMQDDVFMGTLTVREYLRYIALLRLPATMTSEHKMFRVDESLRELNIYHIRDTVIGTDTSRGISGGERKRLAIAAELVVDPSILLLDEPTSGLDSYSASNLLKTLHDLAHGEKKRTIIMSIHQPRSDIFHLFDYLMVFAYGQAAYHGRAEDALQHFATLGFECPPHFNPADFIIDTVSQSKFKEVLPPTTKDSSINVVQPNGRLATVDEYASTFATQFRVLVRRSLIQSFRNPFLLRAQYMVHIVVGLMLGGLYWHITNDLSHGGMQNRMGALFFLVCLLSFGSITSIDLFFSERLLFLRERATGCYRTSAYFLAKAVSDLIPMRVIPPLIVGCIVYYMIGFQPVTAKFFIFLALLVLVSTVSTSMCFLISSLAPSIAVGNFVAILLLFFYLLFGGFLVSLNSMPFFIKWITDLSFIKFSYTGLMINEFDGIYILINPGDMGDDHPITISGVILLDQVGIHTDMLYPDLAALCGILAFFLICTYLALQFAVKEKR